MSRLCEQCGKPRGPYARWCSVKCVAEARAAHGGTIPPKLAVPIVLVIPPPDVPAKDLSLNELAALAVFVLTGEVDGVWEALEKVQSTAWPVDPPDDETPPAAP